MEKLRVKDEDLEFAGVDGGGTAMYTYQGKPFTGIIEDYFFDNAKLAAETEYVNGYLEGIETTYYENGKIATYITSRNNLLHGECKRWDENGNLISETLWKDGELVKTIK